MLAPPARRAEPQERPRAAHFEGKDESATTRDARLRDRATGGVPALAPRTARERRGDGNVLRSGALRPSRARRGRPPRKDPVAATDAAHARWVEDALRSHEAGLLQYATRLVGDADAARDVVQDAFLRLCEQRASDLEGRLA